MIYAFPFAMRPLCLPHPHTVLHGHKRRPLALRLLRPLAVPSTLSLSLFLNLQTRSLVCPPIAEFVSLRCARVVCVSVSTGFSPEGGAGCDTRVCPECSVTTSPSPAPRSRSLSRSVSPPQPRATRLWGMRSHREASSLGDRGPCSRVSAGCVCVCVRLPGSLGTRSAPVPESLEV